MTKKFSISSIMNADAARRAVRSCLMAVWTVLSITGCRRDPELVTTADSELVGIEVLMDVPSAGNPSTRAMTAADECTVRIVDVLVFRVEGQSETFAYRAHETTTPVFTGANTMRFTVSLKRSEADERYRLVFLANLRDEVDTALRSVGEGELKEDVISKIEYAQSGPWPVSGSDMRYIPMWGESAGTALIDRSTTLNSFGGTIQMLRALARVDVALNLEQGDEKPRFEMRRIKVFNAPDRGAAAPGLLSGFTLTEKKVTAPTVLSTSQPIVPALEYTVAGSGTEREIYIGEAANSTASADDNVCLLIEGYYTPPGETLNTDTPTWYRVDFRVPDSSDTHARLDILRNHIYHININYVGGPGDEDEEEAWRRGPYDMETEIIVWSDEILTDVVWLGQYYLAVSRNAIDVPGDEHTESFYVKTNYPSGWKATVSEGGDWLYGLTPGSSPNLEVSEELAFSVTENTDTNIRTGRIAISCGTALTIDVVVRQYTREESVLSLKILNVTDHFGTVGNQELDEILWLGGLHWDESILSPKGFHIDWLPSWAYCNMIKDPSGTYEVERVNWMREAGTNPTTLEHFDEMVIPPTDYGYTFYLTPKRFIPSDIAQDPFLERTTNYYFTVIDNNELVSRTIRLRQVHYNLIADIEANYPLDGAAHSFKVRANRDWTVKNISGDTDLVTIHTFSGIADKNPGVDFHFTTVDNPDRSGTVTVTFSYIGEVGISMDSTGLEYTEEVVISLGSGGGGAEDRFIGGEANCYILHPDGQAVVIPVSQANRGVSERVGVDTEMEPEFIWTDNPNGMSASGAVRSMEVVGSGPTADLVVYPGSGEGNAVVAVKDKASGTILWSWHLWVSDFDPNNEANDFYGFSVYEFLDRNLGALSEAPEDFRSQGLFYQWGRKDPFPYANGAGTNTFIDIYDADGQKLNFPDSYQTATTGVMLDYSIENPLTFITVGYSADWYTTDYDEGTSSARLKMWHPGDTIEDVTKGVYDPCPDGWRVVPGANGGNLIWYSLFDTRTHYTGYSELNGTVSGVGYVDLGVWPHSGMINGGTGSVKITDGGDSGRYWTANPNSQWSATGSLYVGFESASRTELSNEYDRRHALSVRCMRRTE